MNLNQVERYKGFTLIEVLIALLIIGITLGIGLPSFKAQISSSRLTSAANDMLTALRLTRSEAIKQVKLTGISINPDGKSWDSVVLGTPNVQIQSYKLESNVSFTVTGVASAINYRPDGRLASTLPVTLEFSVADSTEKRILTIEPSGSVKLQKIE